MMTTDRPGPTHPPPTGVSPPVVVVLGAGFAGLTAARHLAGRDVQVVVVDQHNFHTFRPLLYQVATAGLSPGDVAYPARAVFGRSGNVTFRHGAVTDVDVDARTLEMSDGTTLGFDRLIVACSSVASYHKIPGAERWTLPLYTLDDARRLRNRLLQVLEVADQNPPTRRDRPLSLAVVGGGPTGVETAGALVELLEVSTKRDRMQLGTPTVTLIDALGRTLNGFSDRSARYAQQTLRARGIDLRLGVPVAAVTPDAVRLADGTTIAADVAIWAGGITVNGTIASLLPEPKGPGGRVVVEPTLALPGHPDIFAAGDAAAIPLSPYDEHLAPQLAQTAIQSGRHAGEQAWRSLRGEPLQGFAYNDKGIMATIGRRAAVAEIAAPLAGKVTLRGTPGWAAWLGLHLIYLIGFRNRLIVVINWAWHYLHWPSGPRLILGDTGTGRRGDQPPSTPVPGEPS